MTPTEINPDPLFDTPTSAVYLDTSVPSMERWRGQGVGPDWIKMNGSVRYRKSALDRYIEECTRRIRRRSHQQRHEPVVA